MWMNKDEKEKTPEKLTLNKKPGKQQTNKNSSNVTCFKENKK